MAEGAYLAAKAAGKEKSMKFIGIDGLPIPSGGHQGRRGGPPVRHADLPDGRQGGRRRRRRSSSSTAHEVPKTQTLETKLITVENATEIYQEANG